MPQIPYAPAPFSNLCLFASLNMAATGEDFSAAEIQVIEKNPASSQGKAMISERDNTAEVISKAVQSQLARMLPNMILETLATKNLEGTVASSQTLNTSSDSLSRLSAGSTQGSMFLYLSGQPPV